MNAQWCGYTSAFAPHIEAYIASKRAMGHKYASEDRLLRLFDAYLATRQVSNVSQVTGDIIEAFLLSRPIKRARSFNTLLGAVRGLFQWMHDQGRITSNPVQTHARRETDRRLPYLFSSREIAKILDVAGSLEDNNRATMRGPTYETIFALLAGLGLRISEAVALRWGDIDLERNVIEVRETKFGKERFVPFGPKIKSRILSYENICRSCGRSLAADHFMFSWSQEEHVSTNSVRNVFRDSILPALEVEVPPGVLGPRVHGLRHSFAVRALLSWYRQGVMPMDRLNYLATFLGHSRPASTSVYLTMTSELLGAANERFEAYAPLLYDDAHRENI